MIAVLLDQLEERGIWAEDLRQRHGAEQVRWSVSEAGFEDGGGGLVWHQPSCGYGALGSDDGDGFGDGESWVMFEDNDVPENNLGCGNGDGGDIDDDLRFRW